MVEEERTMALQGIAAVAWYQGFLDVRRAADGWRIASLKDVQPEDIISLRLGGHMPWREDAAEVSRIHLRCAPDCQATVSKTEAGVATVTVQSKTAKQEVELAQLHSGEWVVLDVRSQR